MRIRWGLALLAAALLASAALNVVTILLGTRYYRQMMATALDPLGETAYAQGGDRPSLAPGEKLVVFFGDSRADYWPPPPGLDGLVFAKRGIAGQSSAQVLGRFDAHVAPLRPDVIVIQVGINDLKAIPVLPGQQAAIVGRCKANIQAIVSRSSALGTTVIVTTVFPFGQVPLWRRPFWTETPGEALDDVNAFIRTLEGSNVQVFDAASVLAGPDGQVRPEFSQDLLHVSPAGYEALNRELASILKTIQPRSGQSSPGVPRLAFWPGPCNRVSAREAAERAAEPNPF